MSWMRFALAVFASGLGSSLTDWFFMGDLLYKRFNKHPEIWRYPDDKGASTAIAWSAPLPFLTCAVFAFACVQLHVSSYGATVKLAIEVWLIAPVPWIVTTSLWMKLQPTIAAAYSVGWLVKLILAAVAVASVLR
ncbi:MAG: hypothetical protein WBF06_07955 [Candidatus Acidiferrales bacterium]